MGRYIARFLVLGLTVIALGEGRPRAAETTGREEESPLKITLRVYNYARVPPAVQIPAEQETAMILRKAGVETAWIDCQLSRAETPKPACDKPFSDLDLILRLLPPSMARAVAPYQDTFGIALAGKGKPGTNAIILYGGVPDLARTGYAHQQDILAAVMAHEIGHLLLGSNSHSSTGIMRAKLTRDELELARFGRLLFTPEQSAQLRAAIMARSQLP
jgi:Zn-dependent protease with chaperone function